MGIRGRMAQTAVAEVLEQEYSDGPGAAEDRLTPLYAAALLKISVELRQPQPKRSLETLLDHVLEGLPIDRQAFQAYLKRNFALVKREEA